MSPALRRPAIALITSLALVAMSGCGSDDEPGAASEPSGSPTPSASDNPTPSETADASPAPKPAGKVVDIDLTRAAEPRKVKVDAGKSFTLRIVADEAGELHVHSTPERYVEFGAGTSNKKLTIEQPGLVDVEDHATDELLIQLEVR